MLVSIIEQEQEQEQGEEERQDYYYYFYYYCCSTFADGRSQSIQRAQRAGSDRPAEDRFSPYLLFLPLLAAKFARPFRANLATRLSLDEFQVELQQVERN